MIQLLYSSGFIYFFQKKYFLQKYDPKKHLKITWETVYRAKKRRNSHIYIFFYNTPVKCPIIYF